MIKIAISGILIMLVISACEKIEKIENFPKTPSKIAVNCLMVPDSGITVTIYKSLSILDNAPNKALEKAKLEIFKDGNLMSTLAGANLSTNYYFPDLKPEPGHSYKLVASMNGYETVSAIADIPVAAEIKKLSTSVYDTSSFSWNGSERYYYSKGKLLLEVKDKEGTSNYYKLSMYKLEYYYSINELGDTIETFTYKNPLQYINNEATHPLIEFSEEFSYYFSDQFVDGKNFSIELPINYTGNTPGTNIIVEFSTLSRDYYLFRQSLKKFNESQNNPFSEPIKVYSNIENGYGIFAGGTTTTREIRYN
jgi:hypothetical protein